LQDQLITKENATRYDELTFIACKEYVLKNKPSVVLLSFSGTDNAGHENHYDEYLQEAQNADRMIGELWRMIQALPEYAGQTTFLITTDHGRGKKKSNWSEHGFFVPGSSQTWYALLGNKIDAQGEIKYEQQSYQKNLHGLITEILAVK
jgi:bisphosphoglycerate-independent phosphoglycerate mutase (AlkP superfamily)